MLITITRDIILEKEILGLLYIDGHFKCYTLEPKNAIASGLYTLDFRLVSPMAQHYTTKYGTHGMPWIRNVPGRKWIYIHIGNTAKDTKGCILIGKGRQVRENLGRKKTGIILSSTLMYKELHMLLTGQDKVKVCIVE